MSIEIDRPAQLLNIARRLFASKGFEGTSLRDIAEEAEITKAALYYHFPNKEALLETIVVTSMASLVESVEAAVACASTPADRVRAFMAASAQFLEDTRDEWVAASNAFWQGSIGDRSSAIAKRDAYEGLLRRCIDEGVSKGTFRHVNSSLATRLLLASLNQVARWHKPSGHLTVGQVVTEYVDMVLFGILMPATNNPGRPTKKKKA